MPHMFRKRERKTRFIDCRHTRNWRMELITDKLLNMNKEVSYRIMLRSTTKEQVKKNCKYIAINNED